MNTRRATRDDVPALAALGRAMYGESRYGRLTDWDEERARASIARVLDRTDCAIWVAGDPPVGFLQAVAVPYFYGDGRAVKAEHLFILPEHRGGTTAARLMASFEIWAAAVGAREKLIGTTTGVHPDATGRFFEKMGFRQIGAVYAKGAVNV